ncbi:unnamed protein product [Mesocestoides corti]|uniref:Uncharacterized protein n=1 Tax=Mesocestoides corti TaxID=53468 RepID=A0A158QVX1_MESCO|nr:unnamed protein product [Mesocestoides corti]
MGIDYCTHSALTNERGCQTNHVEESSDQPAHLLSKVIHDSALLDYADKHTDLSMESPRCTPNAEAGEAVATVASSEYCDANRNADDLENQFSATRPHFATMSYPPDIISTTVSVQRPHCNLDSSQLENSSAEAISTDSLEGTSSSTNNNLDQDAEESGKLESDAIVVKNPTRFRYVTSSMDDPYTALKREHVKAYSDWSLDKISGTNRNTGMMPINQRGWWSPYVSTFQDRLAHFKHRRRYYLKAASHEFDFRNVTLRWQDARNQSLKHQQRNVHGDSCDTVSNSDWSSSETEELTVVTPVSPCALSELESVKSAGDWTKSVANERASLVENCNRTGRYRISDASANSRGMDTETTMKSGVPTNASESKAQTKRPWRNSRRKKERNGLLTPGAPSSNDTLSLDRRDNLVFKNHQSETKSSSDGIARGSSVFFDMEDDGFGNSAMSQLLAQVTDLLTTSASDDAPFELQFSPASIQSLKAELSQLPPRQRLQELPVLTRILHRTRSQSPLPTNLHELHALEGELFDYLAKDSDQKMDPLMTLQRCLGSSKVRPPYNRFLQLHLRSLLLHPDIQESNEMRMHLQNLLKRLEDSPRGLDLTASDSNLLLELVTTANVPIFNAISTPPTIFNHRDSPLIQTAMRIADTAMGLHKLAQGGQIRREEHENLLRDTENLLAAADETPCPLARFVSGIIPAEDKARLGCLVHDLLDASRDVAIYQIPRDKSCELDEISVRLGEVALLCAKFKVAKAHHIVKNRFRLTPNSFHRVCVIGQTDQGPIKEALSLIRAANLAKSQDIQTFNDLLTEDAEVKLSEADAVYLEHILTCGLDFQPSNTTSRQSADLTPKSTLSQQNTDEFLLTVDNSVVRNPFALTTTPDSSNDTENDARMASVSKFFNCEEENAYENESLIKPVDANTSTLGTGVYRGDLSLSSVELVSKKSTLPQSDALCYFKLLPEALLLRNLIGAMQRSPSHLFAYKLAPFQIIQLCDCVRKLSSVEPRSEDCKLIKKLSTEANRHLKVKLKAKTVSRVRGFYRRVQAPILRSSFNKLTSILSDIDGHRADTTGPEVRLNSENTFYLAEICFAVLFDVTDSLSLFFLEQIKHKCIVSSGNAIILTAREFKKLLYLAREATERFGKIGSESVTGEETADMSIRLLSLYKVRALLKSSGSADTKGISKRLLQRHALTQLFNQFPEKAIKRLYSNVAFHVFVAESDCLPEGTQEELLNELSALINTCERTTNALPETVNNLFSPKSKHAKLIDALKSKFVVSSVNNRQLNCDPTVLGQWITSLTSNEDVLISEYSESELDDMRQFLLTQPETQELNEGNLTEELSLSGSDKSLASFEPPKLTGVVSMLAGPAQNSPQCNLLFVLLLEALIKQFDQPVIFINRSIFDEIQGFTSTSNNGSGVVEETNIDALETLPDSLEAVDGEQQFDEAVAYLTDLLLNPDNLVPPEQFVVATKMLRHIQAASSTPLSDNQLSELNVLKTDVSEFSQEVGGFLNSDNSLLFAIASLRGLRSRLEGQGPRPADYTELVFDLGVSRSYISPDQQLWSAVLALERHLRLALADNTTPEINPTTLERVEVFLEQKLANDLVITTSQSIERLMDSRYIQDRGLLSTLQFICIASVLIPVHIEVKLLAMLLCRPITSLSTEDVTMVREILIEFATHLQLPRKPDVRQVRLLIPFLPLALDTQDVRGSVNFDKLLTTVCVANELAVDMKGPAKAKINHALAQIFWAVFFTHEQLTSSGLFGRLFKETTNFASEWLSSTCQTDSGFHEFFFHEFFFIASGVPLDLTAQLSHYVEMKSSVKTAQLISDLKEASYRSESYFHLLQSLFVIRVLMERTSPQVTLSNDQLVTVYHAVATCFHSGYFHGRLEGKVGLAHVLNRIEEVISSEESQVNLSELLFVSPHIRKFVEATLVEAGKALLEDLRSRIAPVILLLSNETGNPLMAPDPVLVREGLEASLSGFFYLPPSAVSCAVRLLNGLDASAPSVDDLRSTCHIINNLFQDDACRLESGSATVIDYFVDLKDNTDLLTDVALAMRNLDNLLSSKALQSTNDVTLFFNSLFTLSRSVRLKDVQTRRLDEVITSETVVSSPTESFSSFSVSGNVKISSGTDAFQSLESSPAVKNGFAVSAPPDKCTLIAHRAIDVKSLIDDINNNDRRSASMLDALIDAYHYSRVLIQSGRSVKRCVDGLSDVFKALADYLPSNGQPLTLIQIKILRQLANECAWHLSRHLREAMVCEDIELSLKLLQGYLSLALPTSTTTPVAAQELVSLRLASLEDDLAAADLIRFVKGNLEAESEVSNNDVTLVALQGAQKALDGFALNTVEQICLLYALDHQSDLLFADLGASVNWTEEWPLLLTGAQRQHLEERVQEWTRTIASLSAELGVAPQNAISASKWISAGLATNAAQSDVTGTIDSICNDALSTETRNLVEQLREAAEPSTRDVHDVAQLIKLRLATTPLDGFVTLTSIQTLELVSALRALSKQTSWCAQISDKLSQTWKRLCLGVACSLACGDTITRVELPAKYLHSHAILSIIHHHHHHPSSVSIEQDSCVNSRSSLPDQADSGVAERNENPPRIRQFGSSLSFTERIRRRVRSTQSMGTISRITKPPQHPSLPKRLHRDDFDWSSLSTTLSTESRRSSLDRLHELIEIRRAVVAGSAKELHRLGYGNPLMEKTLPVRCKKPDKLDLSLLRKRCEEHTDRLLRWAAYEQDQSKMCTHSMQHNFRLLNVASTDPRNRR